MRPLISGALRAELEALIRSELQTRNTWRRRAWLGRRLLLRRLDEFVWRQRWHITRTSDDERHQIVSAMLDLIEEVGALDLLSAGRWAEGLDDPTEATRLPERCPIPYPLPRTR